MPLTVREKEHWKERIEKKIDKAIEKASGVGGEDYVAARYEGFGRGGCSVIIDCLTENNHRTITDFRHFFTKTNSKLGNPGSVFYNHTNPPTNTLG